MQNEIEVSSHTNITYNNVCVACKLRHADGEVCVVRIKSCGQTRPTSEAQLHDISDVWPFIWTDRLLDKEPDVRYIADRLPPWSRIQEMVPFMASTPQHSEIVYKHSQSTKNNR